jgi:mono/diheme cytochrome c family protein
MTGLSPSRRLLGALTVALLIAGVLASCGESQPIAMVEPVMVPVVAQITMPPERTPAPAVESPTPRVAEAIVAVTPVTAVPTAVAAVESEETVDRAETPEAVVALTGAAETGRQQFTALGCIACHGADLSGGIGPELRNRTVDDLPDSRIREQAMQGGNGMPAFPNMTEQELQNFIAFIRSQA